MNHGTAAAEHNQRTVTWQQLQVRAEMEAVAAVDRYERARRLVETSRPEMQSDLPADRSHSNDQRLATSQFLRRHDLALADIPIGMAAYCWCAAAHAHPSM